MGYSLDEATIRRLVKSILATERNLDGSNERAKYPLVPNHQFRLAKFCATEQFSTYPEIQEFANWFPAKLFALQALTIPDTSEDLLNDVFLDESEALAEIVVFNTLRTSIPVDAVGVVWRQNGIWCCRETVARIIEFEITQLEEESSEATVIEFGGGHDPGTVVTIFDRPGSPFAEDIEVGDTGHAEWIDSDRNYYYIQKDC